MKIRLFGSLSHAAQQSEIEMDAVHPISVAELRRTLTHKFPELNRKSFSVALNRKIAADDFQISVSDEIALLPPFAGG